MMCTCCFACSLLYHVQVVIADALVACLCWCSCVYKLVGVSTHKYYQVPWVQCNHVLVSTSFCSCFHIYGSLRLVIHVPQAV